MRISQSYILLVVNHFKFLNPNCGFTVTTVLNHFTFQDQGSFLQSVQAVFESQSEELAKLVAKHIVEKECLMLKNINLTAVDMSALAFVMKHVQRLKVFK